MARIHASIPTLSRRQFSHAAFALTLCSTLPRRGAAHNDAGRVVPPLRAPELRVELESGHVTTLRKVLLGNVTALQLVFTSCRATCPIQGAIFGAVARALPDTLQRPLLLSVTIDPATDTPGKLREFLARHGATPKWHAARPTLEGVETLFDVLKARNAGADRHTPQVYFFDRKARLRMRSVDFPPAEDIVQSLKELARVS